LCGFERHRPAPPEFSQLVEYLNDQLSGRTKHRILRANALDFAAGGGIQVTVVTAKLEFGYMHTLSGPSYGDQGNAFGRLVFQNLF
jgi:hypothetical protein